VVLGDNIFDNSCFSQRLPKNVGEKEAFFFFHEVEDPERFGVPVFDKGKVVAIEEKPPRPKSAFAVIGLYIYPPSVFDIIPALQLSPRGELEISDVNNWYIAKKKFDYCIFPGFWHDAGTRDSLKEVVDWAYENKK
jgi:glucose-1-phosphate thymidylyltransferase